MDNKVSTGKNWADILSIVTLILTIINLIIAFLGLVPLLGLPLRVMGTIVGAILLALSILSCVFCKGGKGKAIASIVLAAVAIGISLPLWIIYVPPVR